jgi:hypothetical protein
MYYNPGLSWMLGVTFGTITQLIFVTVSSAATMSTTLLCVAQRPFLPDEKLICFLLVLFDVGCG